MCFEVGKVSDSRKHLPDQDHDVMRPAKRFRLARQAPAGKRLLPEPRALLPTLNQWKSHVCQTPVPPGTAWRVEPHDGTDSQCLPLNQVHARCASG